MSECVVRMEMPRRCYDCDMANGLTCMATGGTYGRDVPKMTWIRGKPDWCPILCQLPEGHGRLVDADKLADDMKARKAFFGRMSDPQCLVEDAHTIVPAEPPKEDE